MIYSLKFLNKMWLCLNCTNEIKFKEKTGFITCCAKCGWYNRIKFLGIEDKSTDKISKPLNKNEISIIKSKNPKYIKISRVEDKIIFCTFFNIPALNMFKHTSKKTGEALEKFLQYDKNNLSNEEKNLLYKLKSSSPKEIAKKIGYLKAKLDCIELLNHLDF